MNPTINQITTDQIFEPQCEIQWYDEPVFDAETILYFLSKAQGAGIVFLNPSDFNKDGTLKARTAGPTTDDRRSKIGDYLPTMADEFAGGNWVKFICYTLGNQMGLIYTEDEIRKWLENTGPESMEKVKTFALSLLEIWASNVTLKQSICSIKDKLTATQRGYLHDDIQVGAESLNRNLRDLLEFSNDLAQRKALYLELKGEDVNSNSYLKSYSKQLKVFQAYAPFISKDRSKVVGGSILCADADNKHNNTVILSILLNIQAVILRRIDLIKSKQPQSMDFYIKKIQDSDVHSQCLTLLELRTRHIKFYESLGGLLEALGYSIEEAQKLIKPKIDRIDVNFPLPSHDKLYRFCIRAPKNSALCELRNEFMHDSDEQVDLDLEQMEILMGAIKAEKTTVSKGSQIPELTHLASSNVQSSSARMSTEFINKTDIARPSNRRTKRSTDLDQIPTQNKKTRKNNPSVAPNTTAQDVIVTSFDADVFMNSFDKLPVGIVDVNAILDTQEIENIFAPEQAQIPTVPPRTVFTQGTVNPPYSDVIAMSPKINANYKKRSQARTEVVQDRDIEHTEGQNNTFQFGSIDSIVAFLKNGEVANMPAQD